MTFGVRTAWPATPLKFLLTRRTVRRRPSEPLLSVYRDHGVVPREGRDDNHNRPGKDLSNYLLVRHGDLVVNKMKAWQGSMALSDHRGIVSPAYYVFGVAGIGRRFLHYVLRSRPYVQRWKQISAGVRPSQWDLDIHEFGRTAVPVPDVEVQRRIADFLDRKTGAIDELIAKKERLIELLEEKRQALITQAVTKGLDPNVPMKDSGNPWIGRVPSGWQEWPLKRLFGIKHGYAFDGARFSDTGDHVLLTPGNFHERGGFRQKAPETYYAGDFPVSFVLRAGQLVVAMTEQAPGLLGCALFVPDDQTYLHNQRLGLVTNVRDDVLTHEFLYHLFNVAWYRAAVSITATGSKVKHTSPSKMLEIKAWLPPVDEQRAIAALLDDATSRLDHVASKIHIQIARLREYRSALVTAAVTGQLEVA